ncbi:MAG: hypothetical protein LAT84_08765 [Balneolia bacterium]|nr:hypothetical protein [Balneolia bacterium]
MNNRDNNRLLLQATIGKNDFIKRITSVIALTIFIAGYFWILSVNYPSMIIFPIVFAAVAVLGHTIAATFIVRRLRTLGDYSKTTSVIFIPFFGAMYALPTALIDNERTWEDTYIYTEAELENAA